MKNVICGSVAILLAALIAAAMPTEAEARIYEDTLRLHILAASDSEEDQALKLFIRDKLLSKYGDLLSGSESLDAAADAVYSLIPEIESDCNLWINEAGFDYLAVAELCNEWYDTRVYEEFTLPKGEYLSLKIKLGEASGKNWWCVMFPPLCLDVATEKGSTSEKGPQTSASQSYSKEESALISNKKYNIKFKLLELFSDAFFKKG